MLNLFLFSPSFYLSTTFIVLDVKTQRDRLIVHIKRIWLSNLISWVEITMSEAVLKKISGWETNWKKRMCVRKSNETHLPIISPCKRIFVGCVIFLNSEIQMFYIKSFVKVGLDSMLLSYRRPQGLSLDLKLSRLYLSVTTEGKAQSFNEVRALTMKHKSWCAIKAQDPSKHTIQCGNSKSNWSKEMNIYFHLYTHDFCFTIL